MRRTGSEEIGSSKALGRAGMIPGLPRVLLLVIFLVKLQSGGLGSQNTTMPGALCPGFIFAFVFYWLELPTDCAIQPFYYARPQTSCNV